MKFQESAFRKWMVFGGTAFIFSFIWQEMPDLANTQITSVRFAFMRMMTVVGCGSVVLVWLGRRHFRASWLDWAIVVYAGYVWTRCMVEPLPDMYCFV